MNWTAAQKRIEAERKREERGALKRQRELARMLKEQAKLSAQEQARLDFEAFENSLDVLVSVHKDASPKFDWIEPLSSLPPHLPIDSDLAAYEQERVGWEKMRALARRVLAGEAKAYGEALTELSPFSELSTLGSSIAFRVHDPKLIECELSVSGRDVIPAEMKSLTAAGKVSVKAMPRARFHEIYQDYVCGCVLRVAREVLALLPVDAVIITANVTTLQSSTGTEGETPVLSVAVPRQTVEQLDFTRLDPSDSMENFTHRGDVIASRKSGEFPTVVPLKPADTARNELGKLSLAEVLDRVREMRAELAEKLRAPALEAGSRVEVTP